jgi:hypothetical protein
METSTPSGSPLRQRMLEDMHMRQLAPKTQDAYIRAVYKLAAFTKKSPDAASAEDLRRFQLHLVDADTSPITLNATITGLTFFYCVTLERPDVMAKMQSVRVPHKLPVVLSREEVARLLGAVGHIKHQTSLSVAYGTGFRVSVTNRTHSTNRCPSRHNSWQAGRSSFIRNIFKNVVIAGATQNAVDFLAGSIAQTELPTTIAALQHFYQRPSNVQEHSLRSHRQDHVGIGSKIQCDFNARRYQASSGEPEGMG